MDNILSVVRFGTHLIFICGEALLCARKHVMAIRRAMTKQTNKPEPEENGIKLCFCQKEIWATFGRWDETPFTPKNMDDNPSLPWRTRGYTLSERNPLNPSLEGCGWRKKAFRLPLISHYTHSRAFPFLALFLARI